MRQLVKADPLRKLVLTHWASPLSTLCQKE